MREHAAALRSAGTLAPDDASLGDAALLQRYCDREAQARRHQL